MVTKKMSPEIIKDKLSMLIERLDSLNRNDKEYEKKLDSIVGDIIYAGYMARPSFDEIVRKELHNEIGEHILDNMEYLKNMSYDMSAASIGAAMFDFVVENRSLSEGYYIYVAENEAALEAITFHEGELYERCTESVNEKMRDWDVYSPSKSEIFGYYMKEGMSEMLSDYAEHTDVSGYNIAGYDKINQFELGIADLMAIHNELSAALGETIKFNRHEIMSQISERENESLKESKKNQIYSR